MKDFIKPEIQAKLDEINQLNAEESELDWRSPEEKERCTEIWNRVGVLNQELRNYVAELGDSDVIKTLKYLTDHGISPVPALNEWISSWC